jgi:aspartyl-tRNA(Asn)/glutamyl-tRNA(Gln) amidotransferase subunit A
MSIFSLSIGQMHDLLTRREISSRELTLRYLERIERENAKFNAFTTVCADEALRSADSADERIREGENITPILGIPMGVKDNLCTSGVRTTCASRMLENFIPAYTATAVSRLMKSGGVLLGKLNMDEFAMGSSTENSIFGPVRNPWDTGRVAGGSSGGAAAAVASGLAVFALGSDTGGSVRQPASFCGVVGLKPTYGRVSRYGLVAFASSLDQIGPITRDVADCAAVLNDLAAYDPMDSTSVDREREDYSEGIEEGVASVRIGIPREYFEAGLDDDVRDRVLETVKKMEADGAVGGEISLPSTPHAIPAYYLISSAEASANLARYDGIKYGYRSGAAKNLNELYRLSRGEGFGREVKRRILLGTHALSSGYHDELYNKALKVRRLIADDFRRAFESCDVIASPAYPTTAFRLGEKIDDPLKMYLGDILTVGVNLAGLPALVVPCGIDRNGLPVGIQLIGKPFSEKLLLRVGYAVERLVGKLAPQIPA